MMRKWLNQPNGTNPSGRSQFGGLPASRVSMVTLAPVAHLIR